MTINVQVKTNFHNKGRAEPGLVLKQRQKTTRKLPIKSSNSIRILKVNLKERRVGVKSNSQKIIVLIPFGKHEQTSPPGLGNSEGRGIEGVLETADNGTLLLR